LPLDVSSANDDCAACASAFVPGAAAAAVADFIASSRLPSRSCKRDS
jgi:hypothetical protein